MPQRLSVAAALAFFVFALVLVGCGSEANPTTTTPTTASPSTTSPPSEVTTTTAVSGPRPLPSGGFLDPGVEYVTTIFEPVVGYRTDEKLLLQPFQTDAVMGLQNQHNLGFLVNAEDKAGLAPYRGVVIHNVWRGFSPDEAIARIEEIDVIEVEATSQVEVGGFAGTQIDVVVLRSGLLYEMVPFVNCNRARYCALLEIGPMRIVVLDTPTGTLLVTIDPPGEDFEDFFPIAEEILAGISFPDLD